MDIPLDLSERFYTLVGRVVVKATELESAVAER